MFNFKENISLAVNGLRSNKMRALLTMLGIIIGISSVITIVTVGDSMTKSITDVFNDMGANSVQLYIIDRPDENGNTNWSRPYQAEDYISDEMIDQFLEAFGDRVACWAVSENVGPGQAINGHNKADGRIQGVNANALGINNIDIIAGHDLNEREVSGEKSVAVISDKFVEDLFPGLPVHEALGKEIKLQLSQGTYTFTVVGVYQYEVSGMAAMMGAGSVTTNVFIPMGVAKDMIRDTDSVTNVTDGYYAMQIKGNEKVTDSKAFTEEIDNYFNNKLYRSNKYVMVRAESMDSMIGEMTSSLDMIKLAISIIAAISLLVGGIGVMNIMLVSVTERTREIGTSSLDMIKLAISIIAAISLLVGGIGVMNIMLVSVTERTREIGTRKALGAKNIAIRVQFIVESMIICLFGGVIGVILGTTLGRLGSTLLGAPGWPSVSIVLIAVGFSMGIGVFFGYYPANKAAKLDPIEALRYE